ncbi:MAG: YaiI/YqxD family protein [Marinicellaceae bacterium]
MGKLKIWVDADACPNVIKDIIFRASDRTQTFVTLIANQYIQTPPSKFINSIQVQQGFDVADDEIIKRIKKGDLVITADIPLASEAIEKGAIGLNPRGDLYTKDNIKARLQMRNFMESLRSSGIDTGGPKALSHKDREKFANCLDKILG